MAKLITKAKQIIIAAWGDSDVTYPTTGEQLDYVIAGVEKIGYRQIPRIETPRQRAHH